NKGNSVTSGTAEAESAPKPLRGVPVKPISGGVLNGRAVELPKPEYPEIARRARTTGIVAVEVVIDVSGKVLSAKAISGPSMLHRAAEQAAQRAKFTPTLLSGQPVKMTGTINYNFSF
ncbi:MAG: energy transducer TonB, partial [Pyrinomonadaceae bacterium]